MADIIQLLPDAVSNQIAAGEVIQRPASAVKEMMENAIDAGADKIQLILKDAGKTLIQVIDNGCGMSGTDARLSFERHATSKIRKAEDLFVIRTMGFRGEALASIAAIAQVEMKTRLHDEETGNRIRLEGSKFIEQEICACPVGTSIAIKNLFFNVPARRKFLKSDNAETRHVMDEFHRIALAHPEIQMSFHHNDKAIYQLDSTNLKQRIIALFGHSSGEKLVPLDQETTELNIDGFLVKPENARKTRGDQFFFVNGRYFRHSYLHHAVQTAFEGLIPENSFPGYYICMHIDPAKIDVNIHPTKTEINFQDNKLIYSILHSTIKQSLGKYSLTPSIDFDIDHSIIPQPKSKGEAIPVPNVKLDPEYDPFKKTGNQSSLTNLRNWNKLYDDVPEKTTEQTVIETDSSSVQEQVLMQVNKKFILSPVKSGLMVVHIKRAQERIHYEKLMIAFDGQGLPSQKAIFPESIELPPQDSDILEEILDDLKHYGLDIDAFGKNSWVVNGIPEMLKNKTIREFIEEIIENYKQTEKDPDENLRQSMALIIAQSLSPRNIPILKREEKRSLVDQLFACPTPETTATGKRIIRIVKMEELDNWFK